MKRPFAGLLASAAAVPGAWLLAGTDEPKGAALPELHPEEASQPIIGAAPAERLAAIEPAFGGAMHAGVQSLPTRQPRTDEFRLPRPVAVPAAGPVAVAEPLAQIDAPPADFAANLPALTVAAPQLLPAFVEESVVQAVPTLAKTERSFPALDDGSQHDQPALATNVPTTVAASETVPIPVVAPVLVKVESTPPPKLPMVAEPVVQPFPAPIFADVVPISPSRVQQTGAPVEQPAQSAERLIAGVVAPSAPPQPALAEVVAARPAPTPPLSEPVPSPLTMPAPKLPVGEVVLAAFAPARALAATTPPALIRAHGATVEPTVARTVPVGAPERVVYPEPAFGPPEARFIPAAYSSNPLPEPAAALGSASTLAQAIAYSYETNPRLLAERASTRAADLGYPAARAAFGPRLDANASLSYTRDRDEVLPGSFLRQQGWSDTASLILSQPLLTFGRSQARVGQAAANIDYRRESLRLVQDEVMLDVIAAYVGTLREAGAVTIARENVALLQRQLEESNARFAVREITLADVQQVETRLALGKTGLLDAQARLGEIQSRFYRAVGMPPGELAPPEPLTLPIASLSEAYSLADNDSPLVRAALARERVSRAFLAGTRAEAAPRVDFRGSADYGSVSEYTRDLRGTRVRGTVTLSVPLFDSGGRSAESGQAREANAADLQLVAAAQRDSRTAVATGWNRLLAARMSIDHYRQAVESAERAYENSQRQERAGMRTTLDVLDLARDLLNVRNAYNTALADEYQARAELLATLGQLDPAKMSSGLKLYDPADHFRKVRSKGDIPLLTGTLAALDGVTLPNLKTDRPSPDPSQLIGTAETVTGE